MAFAKGDIVLYKAWPDAEGFVGIVTDLKGPAGTVQFRWWEQSTGCIDPDSAQVRVECLTLIGAIRQAGVTLKMLDAWVERGCRD